MVRLRILLWRMAVAKVEAASTFKSVLAVDVGSEIGDGRGVETEACFERGDRDK